MAGRKGFFKIADPALNDGEDGGVIDPDTDVLSYQMIPVGNVRKMGVIAPEGTDCIVEFKHQVAEFAARKFLSATASTSVIVPTPNNFRQELPAGVAMHCDVHGLVAGQSEIVLRASGGGPVASIKIGVKEEVKIAVSACRLTDIVTKNPYTVENIRACVARAKVVYKNCANINLIVDPAVYPIESDIELGNPIILGRQVTEYTREDSTVLKHIKAKVPKAARAANFVCIFAWDFEITHLPLVGLNLGQLCFIEWDAQERNRALTLEHEIGHGLGLGHSSSAYHTIMDKDGINGVERFEGNEIDIVNTTGNQSRPSTP